MKMEGRAPIVVLYGEPDVGKTKIANAISVLGIEACSFRGMHREFFVYLLLPKLRTLSLIFTTG